MGVPLPIFGGKLGAPKFWVQWEGIGKFQAIVTKFFMATTVGQRNMPAKFQLNRPKNGEVMDPKVWVLQHYYTQPDRYYYFNVMTLVAKQR